MIQEPKETSRGAGDDETEPATHEAEALLESDLGYAHPIDELVRALHVQGQARATGLSGSYTAAALAQVAGRLKGRLVVVTPTLERARALAKDLCGFGLGAVGDRVLVLPPPDVSPYSDVSPDRNRTIERLNTQFRLAMSDTVRAVLLPVEGAMRRVTPWSAIESTSTVLSVGETVDLEAVRGLLARAGYANVRLVEDPGTFAVRGGILDVYSPFEDYPARLDLFGDEIESIRLFDPETQRTFRDLDELYVFPVREEIVNEESLARAQRRLRKLADEQSLPSSLVNELLNDLKSGHRFFGIEGLLPALFELESPLDLVREGAAAWVVEDPDAVAEEAQKIWDRRQLDYERAVADGELAFPLADFLEPAEQLVGRLRVARPAIEIVPVGLGEEPLTFRAHANADVLRLRRTHDESEGTVHALVGLTHRWRPHYGRIAFACRSAGSRDRLGRLLRNYGQKVEVVDGPIPLDAPPAPPAAVLALYQVELSSGFRCPAMGLAVVADNEIFGRTTRRAASQAAADEALAIRHFRELEVGDYVVHLDFGIARYAGMEKLTFNGVAGDYLKLEFAESDRVYLPVYRLGRVQKYVSGGGDAPSLDKLGGTRWEKQKAKIREDLRELAEELLRIYAERKSRQGFSFQPPGDYFQEFEAAFPFEETPHQETAIHEVVHDMTQVQPMDRLLCGDVGFGKTEVAMRAAYLAVLSGKQVAVLVPTTILADQHARTFGERFRNTPVVVEAISRFRKPEEVKKILADAAEGKVDVLIGTHRLLSKDVTFRTLGLLVIDEEQRFGVKHKERLKQLKATVDVLAMSATPIPRTLEMSLLGIRDLSVILTPPADRLSVRTYVAPFKESVIREGIERELQRGGQVFFVHNRVQGIEEVAASIRDIVPTARVSIGHAQMADDALERVMHDFVARRTDVLVCTTIIESGLDIVSANTIFINRADALGLSQLYQLRGRVGRGRERGFCYLLVPARRKLPQDAARRLEVIRTHTELGSGITIAQHDLDLRGAGNLLGKDQSGHIRTIGYDLFCELLEEAIREQRGEKVAEEIEPEVKIPVEAYLPTQYVPDEGLRLLFYKRLSLARSREQLDGVLEELVDRFGRMPEEAERLRAVIQIKIALAGMGIEVIEAGPAGVVITLGPRTTLSPDKVVELVARHQGRYVLREDMKLIRRLGGKERDDVLGATQLVVSDLERCRL